VHADSVFFCPPPVIANGCEFFAGIRMSAQPELFHETFIDAIREVIEALGGAKKIGPQMRPEKSTDAAARWVLDCLNPDRDHRFDPDQVRWLLREGRRIGCHSAARFLMREAGYADPVPIEPDDERAKLQRDFIDAVSVVNAIAKRLDRVGER
jgi:hypothetical protein